MALPNLNFVHIWNSYRELIGFHTSKQQSSSIEELETHINDALWGVGVMTLIPHYKEPKQFIYLDCAYFEGNLLSIEDVVVFR